MAKTMEETVVLIQEGLEGIKKNTATKTEVLTLIEDRIKIDKDALAAVEASAEAATEGMTKANASITELKEQAESLKSQLRLVNSGGIGKFAGPGGRVGMFASANEAKAFGLLLMAATTSDVRRAKSFHEKAIKSLEKMGIEPIWLDAMGKAMTTGSQASGSALVTIEQIPSIIMAMEAFGSFRRNTTVVPMGAASTVQPKIDGLLTCYVPGEGGTISDDDPEIAILNLTPKTMTALTGYSAELEEDAAVGLALLLGPLFAKSFAYYEDLCGFLGDGTATYFGFTGVTGALKSVSATIAKIRSLIVGSGNAYSELVIGDFEKVIGQCPEYAAGNAKWYVHRYFYYTVMVARALSAGNANAVEVITGAGSKQRQYLGYDVDFTQVLPRAEANSQICSLFGDLAQATMLGTRGGVEFASSTDRYFEKATSAPGPIIGLITAAS